MISIAVTILGFVLCVIGVICVYAAPAIWYFFTIVGLSLSAIGLMIRR